VGGVGWIDEELRSAYKLQTDFLPATIVGSNDRVNAVSFEGAPREFCFVAIMKSVNVDERFGHWTSQILHPARRRREPHPGSLLPALRHSGAVAAAGFEDGEQVGKTEEFADASVQIDEFEGCSGVSRGDVNGDDGAET